MSGLGEGGALHCLWNWELSLDVRLRLLLVTMFAKGKPLLFFFFF